MKNIAIFASGNGSNAENIIHYFDGSDAVKVALILSNKADAYVIERAHRHQIPSVVFSAAELNREGFMLQLMQTFKIDGIVLAGFLLKISVELIAAYPQKIINIHPALLPKYGGKGMYGAAVHQAVWAAQEPETGITIHFVNEHYDEGAIIFQARCPITPQDTPDTIAAKVHALEYEHFPRVIGEIGF